MSFDSQVVITGLGVVCPIGIGIDQYWQSLLAGKSGVRVREEFAATELPLRIYAPVIDFDGKLFVKPRKAMKVMCMPIQFGCAAAAMATDQAGLADAGLDPDRVGTVLGSETFFADPMEVASVFRSCVTERHYVHDRWGEFAMRDIQPLWMLKYLPNMVASHISIAVDARGPSNSICQGESSGLLALIEGADLIRRGACDVVIVGGTGSEIAISAILYHGQELMSRRIHEPEKASRPFDRDRDGIVYGEGAGAMVLESREHAMRRNAKVLGTVASWSRTFAVPESREFRDAIAFAMQSSLEQSGLSIDDVSHVNAHGTSLIEPDIAEANAIHQVCGNIPVVAQKSNFGYIGPSGPIVELVGSVLAINAGVLPPSLNFEHQDSACPVNVCTEKTALTQPAVIKNSFSATGQIASVVVAK